MPSESLPMRPHRGATQPPSPGSTARRLAADARRRLPLLWFAGWAALAISLLLLVLAGLDGRTFNGVSVWTKPWKFHVSVGVHLLTLAWCAAMLPDTPARARALGRMGVVAMACSVFELAYITWRAARGEASHFNQGSLFAIVMYGLMGFGAVALTACAGWLGWQIGRARDFAFGPVLQRGLALGLVLGFVLGTVAGIHVGGQTGHWVGGTPSDAQGLALMGWSRDGGDLRVAHFFGLHAMQLFPVVAWFAARIAAPAAALRGVNAFAAVYVLFTVFTLVQAVMGRPFI